MTYTAQQFEIKFYEAMAKWAVGGKVGPDPRGEWEYGICNEWDSPCTSREPCFDDYDDYRWKQPKKRTVPIEGVELVAPEVDKPAVGAQYFVEMTDGSINCFAWDDLNLWPRNVLKHGKVFLTREDCQAMADAQRKQRLGGAL